MHKIKQLLAPLEVGHVVDRGKIKGVGPGWARISKRLRRLGIDSTCLYMACRYDRKGCRTGPPGWEFDSWAP